NSQLKQDGRSEKGPPVRILTFSNSLSIADVRFGWLADITHPKTVRLLCAQLRSSRPRCWFSDFLSLLDSPILASIVESLDLSLRSLACIACLDVAAPLVMCTLLSSCARVSRVGKLIDSARGRITACAQDGRQQELQPLRWPQATQTQS